MNDKQIEEWYDSLRNDCLENKVFKAILVDIEKEILESVKESPESAIAAHYEFLALKRLNQRIAKLQHDVTAKRHILDDSSDY